MSLDCFDKAMFLFFNGVLWIQSPLRDMQYCFSFPVLQSTAAALVGHFKALHRQITWWLLMWSKRRKCILFAEMADVVVVTGRTVSWKSQHWSACGCLQHGTSDKCPTSIIDLLIVAHVWTCWYLLGKGWIYTPDLQYFMCTQKLLFHFYFKEALV